MDSEVVTRLDRIESLLAALLSARQSKITTRRTSSRDWSVRQSSPCASGRGSAASMRRSDNRAEALIRRGSFRIRSCCGIVEKGCFLFS